MSCDFEHICKKAFALKQIQCSNGFTSQDYPITELKRDVCDHDCTDARECCPAHKDIQEHGHASWWVK